MRAAAVEALGALGRHGAPWGAEVARRLEHRDRTAREAAVAALRALGRVGAAAQVAPEVARRLEHPEEYAREQQEGRWYGGGGGNMQGMKSECIPQLHLEGRQYLSGPLGRTSQWFSTNLHLLWHFRYPITGPSPQRLTVGWAYIGSRP